ERLAEHVVDLVRARVAEVLPFEVDPRATAVLREPPREVERRGAARVVGEELGEPPPPGRVAPRRPVRALELEERGHERLRDEAPPEAPEAAVTVGERGHRTPFASATNRHTLSGSLRPGSASTPELTSTAYGRAVATARATFSGVRPAERMIRHCWLPSSRATARTIGATRSGVTKRGVSSTKMNPSASAPASTAVIASSRRVIPQTFTRTIFMDSPRLRPRLARPYSG